MFTKTAISFLIVLQFNLTAQSPAPSGPEIRWAFFHPFAALKVKKITKQCDQLFTDGTIKEQLDSFASGGQLDACRHVFYMAAYAQKIRVKKIRKLGAAHERSNYRQFLKQQNELGELPDSLASVMDLRNNELGLAIGCNNRELEREKLRKMVIDEIKKGKAVIFKRDAGGRYVDCNNKPITPQTTKSWFIPKCLVPSNYKSSS